MATYKKIMTEAEHYCAKHSYRFTDPRKQVLKTLLQKQRPLGAYDILSLLTRSDYQPKPPTIYRAIDFWVEHGFVHKIMSLNAYIACSHLHTHNLVSFLICDTCHLVQEVHLKNSSDNFHNIENFKTKSVLTEIHGTCHSC